MSSISDYQHMHLGKNSEILKSCMHLAGSCLLGMGEKEHLSGNEKHLCLLVKKKKTISLLTLF